MSERLQDHLDAVAGTQLAMMPALAALLRERKDDPAFAAALQADIERMRSNLLASVSRDRKIEAFEETAKILLLASQGKG